MHLRTHAALLGAGLALVLTACSGDDAEAPTATATAAAVESADPARVSPADLPTAPALKEEKGAVNDVSFGACSAEAGEQTVSAEVTGSGERPRDYAVTVSWINEDFDVLGRAVEVVEDLEPGASRTVELAAEVPQGAAQCTFHVVRGTLR